MAFVQVGMMAMRDKDGNFLPSTPLYAEIADEEMTADGITKTEERALADVAKLFAEKFKAYADAERKMNRARRK